MSLKLYNTFAKKEETFVPLHEGKVTMYTCGPTVYGRPHIGNYSSFLMADLLRRWLEVSGYAVTHVKNITDVGHLVADQDEGEDKIERQAREEKADPLAIARKYTEQYLADEKALNMREPEERPKATEFVGKMIEIIRVLVDAGHAYETSDGVYFAVESFPDYGKLSGNTLEQLNAGARIDVKEEKKHPADFALWKKTVGANAHHILKWPSPWGDGFPGWHIECSAMARALLGARIDIHTGGEDNIFPHHECEIAQSECSGPRPFVRYWLHKRRIDIALNDAEESQKMSKSLGNILTLDDIAARAFDPLDLRYYLLSVHYRTRLKFTWRGLEDAKKARRKIIEWMSFDSLRSLRMTEGSAEPGGTMEALEQVRLRREDFANAMDADLNTPAALAAVFEMMTWSRNQLCTDDMLDEIRQFIDDVRRTFGCFESSADDAMPADVQSLIDARAQARTEKNFAESDRLRDKMADQGYEVKDTADGQKVRRK